MSEWEVVGGTKGGILVKEGKELTSTAFQERLSTGARIREKALVGDRLHYTKISGDGPQEGWVSIKITGSKLCVRLDQAKSAAAAAPPLEPLIPQSAPRCLQRACDTAPPLKQTKVLPPLIKYMAMKKLLEACEKRCKGDMYGLLFPQTPEEMVDDSKFGAEWLTKAFQASGALPQDNKVTKIVSWRRFEGGGSGPKCLFEVEYDRPDETLDTMLFAKMPHPVWENQQQRFIEEGQAKFGDNWGGEISFYRFLSPHVPFPSPKFYFGDLSRESTEAILINACVTWPEKGQSEFGAYQVFPPCGKCEDYLLTNPQDYYFAVMRRLGTFTGLAKSNKLGPELEKINWHNCTTSNDVNCLPGFPRTEISARSFIENVAPHWFPGSAKSKQFLDKFVEEFADVQKNHSTLASFLYADPMFVGLFHQNGNSDNCYFYRREDGTVDAGVLDWGSTCHMSFGTGFMGCTISALAEMLAEHDEAMIQTWADAYHATGAPKLDFAELLLRYRVATCLSSYGIYSSTNQMVGTPKAMEASKENFKALSSWNCDAIRADFGTRFGMGMLYNRIMLFALKGDVYWAAAQEVIKRSPPKK